MIWWLTSPCYSLWSLSGLMLCGYDVSEKCPKAENEHFIDCRWNCCSWNCEWMHLQIASTLPHFEIASTLPHFADCSTVQCLHINTLQIALPCSMPRRSHSSLRAPPVAQVLGMVFSSSDFNAFLETVTVLALNTTTTLMPGLLGENLLEMLGGGFEIQIIAFWSLYAKSKSTLRGTASVPSNQCDVENLKLELGRIRAFRGENHENNWNELRFPSLHY